MDYRYSASVEWSDEDGEFVALCPEFPGASGSGDTPEEAVTQLRESIEILVETYQDQGLTVPRPTAKETYSGQVRLRLPKDLHRLAAMTAERQGVSLNSLFLSFIAQGIGRDDRLHQEAELRSLEHRIFAYSTSGTATKQADDAYGRTDAGIPVSVDRTYNFTC